MLCRSAKPGKGCREDLYCRPRHPEARVGLYADGIALQAEMDEDGPELTVLGESGSFRARTHRLQQRLSASLRRRMDGKTRRCAGCHDYRRPELSVFGHAQRLPGRGSCPCAGGKRNAWCPFCAVISSAHSALRVGAELPQAQMPGGIPKSAGLFADGRDRLHTLGMPRRSGGLGRCTGCVAVRPAGIPLPLWRWQVSL